MEDRSSRRMRTLVTQMAPVEACPLSERRRADIHDGPEQMLQSKAGYIDARPLTTRSTKTSCNARPDHTSGSECEILKRSIVLPGFLRQRTFVRFLMVRRPPIRAADQRHSAE